MRTLPRSAAASPGSAGAGHRLPIGERLHAKPPVVISVNECDPLRDEGINFYRLLLEAGVPAQCRQLMGTSHAADTMPILCPEISRETARSIADFCRGG